MWPYCTQAIYYTGMPTIVNVTIINGLGVSGYITELTWHPYVQNDNGKYIDVSLTHSDVLWPWSGWLAVAITVPDSSRDWQGIVQGTFFSFQLIYLLRVNSHSFKTKYTDFKSGNYNC